MDPLVLDLLFQNFDVTTLKSCRLVCKEWYETSLTEWRKRAVVCIGNVSGSPLKPPCDRIPGGAKLSLKKWNKVWTRKDDGDLLRLREVPYRRIKIWDWSEWGVAETVFMKQTGPYIRQLEFVNCDFTKRPRNFRGLLDDVKLFMRQCSSSIRKLRFEECGFEGLTRNFSWPQFVRRVTDLRELSLPKMSLSTFMSILGTIEGIRSGDESKLQLRRLSLFIGAPETRTTPEFWILQEFKWPLRQVSIDLEDNCGLDELILESCRTTLEVIRVCEPSNYLGWLSNEVFPFLKKLELIWRTKVPNQNLLLTFLKRMLNLKELILKSKSSIKSSYILYSIVERTVNRDPEMSTLTFPNMESLHFASWGGGTFDPPSVAQFVKWMPNLKRLIMPVCTSCLPIIFANLKQLEELKTLVFSFHDIDNFESFFTGYSPIPNEEGIHEKVAPGISDLTNLKTFSILTLFEPGWTDFCFSQGFLRMPRLQKIFIAVNDDTQFSEEMRSRIKSTFPRGVIEITKSEFGAFGEILFEYLRSQLC